MDYFKNQNFKINNLNKPGIANSGNKIGIKNLDNNISYSQSDEENSELNKNGISDISRRQAKILNKVKDSFQKDKIRKNINIKINRNRINKNNYYKNKDKYKVPNNSINKNNNYKEVTSEEIEPQKRQTYGTYIKNKKLSGYSNYFMDNKRALSGEKKKRQNHLFYSPIHNPYYIINRLGANNQKYEYSDNKNFLNSNYAPTYANTKITKIKKAPLDEVKNINNLSRNRNNDYYTTRINNNYQIINYLNPNNNLNQTTPNFVIGNFITSVKKLPSKKIEEKYINSNHLRAINSDEIHILQINRANKSKKYFELPGENKTIGYQSLRKPFSNEINIENYQRLNSNNQPNISNRKPLLPNPIYKESERKISGSVDNNIDEDGIKYHDLSLTLGFLNRQGSSNEPIFNNKEINQNQINNIDINYNRTTLVKKLSPLRNNIINKTDLIDSRYQRNQQINEQIINNQNKRPINVKKLINKEIPKINNINNSNEKQSNSNIININLPNNPINKIIYNDSLNQRINQIPEHSNQKDTNQTLNKGNINKNNNFENHQLNPVFNKNESQQIKDKYYAVLQQNQQKNIISQSNINQIINREYNEFNKNQNNISLQNKNQLKPQIINSNPILSPKKNQLNNIDSIRDTIANTQTNNNGNQNENLINNAQNNSPKRNNVNISYNDFDASGWVKNYGGVSRPGKDMYGNQKINQDSFVSLTNINNIKDFNIFGVLDGHGPQGHFVSGFASDFIPSQIINNSEIKSLNDPEKIYKKLKDNNCQIITKAFLVCDEELENQKFDPYDSGTTCILVIHIGAHIICANVGDSRAIVSYDDRNNDSELKYLEIDQLSIDYKPELLEEKKRILNAGGVIEKMTNEFGEEVGPYRVWARGADYPGLAMSRSIGDLVGKNIGIIPDPGITEYDLCESSKYIVICSDGVWEFLNNEEVQNIGKGYYLENNASEFCHQIVNSSVLQWQKHERNIDDITVVALFF